MTDLWRTITDNLSSYLGSVVVTALVAAVSWPFRRWRASAEEKVPVYLGASYDEMEEHREAVKKRLARQPVELVENPGPKKRAAAIEKAKMFVGLYAWQYGELDATKRSVSDLELAVAAQHHGGNRLRLWRVLPRQPHWTLGHQDDDYNKPDSRIGLLRERVETHRPDQLPSDAGRLARAVADAVREVRREEIPQSKYLDSVLDPQSFAVGAFVAIGASIYFAIRLSAADAGSFWTVLTLSLICGVAAYAIRVLTSIWVLR
ncbi:DUF4062 domain-containing protein [Actinoplanes bogorensis]|uniref:DUF4062 domain-containing protein n=1 Tax=Paractinoplanes bogorensis TaxID=1610840 RepID=A0ABS5YMX0_9ACTN|nr:DUF4062 domain-containing protein [Actinoplanes bogorensis]MBU2664811.1 DUF4062 domain-containing protein [Actinoplanes bogorensis]